MYADWSELTLWAVPGYLKGFVRRFAQASHDHRGTPQAPGRVVTLVHQEDWEKFSEAVRLCLAVYSTPSNDPVHSGSLSRRRGLG
jgi:cation transport regulator ChaC